MSLIKVLSISVFIFFKSVAWDKPGQAEKCNDLTVKATITHIEGKGSMVEINAKGAVPPYKYLFYKESGHLLTEDFDTNTITISQKGKYFCTVLGKKGCYKTIELEIK